MSFFCGHLDHASEQCLKLKVECVPGRRGCVLRGKVTFLVDPDERVARRSRANTVLDPIATSSLGPTAQTGKSRRPNTR